MKPAETYVGRVCVYISVCAMLRAYFIFVSPPQRKCEQVSLVELASARGDMEGHLLLHVVRASELFGTLCKNKKGKESEKRENIQTEIERKVCSGRRA